ncbi:MAG TPA: hypothetical protein G4O15_09925 [Dehalococcoidia bacterium]|nr:hypothetical protein [Dehalococcoidia bacterium]
MSMRFKLYISIIFLCIVLSAISGCGKDEYNIGEEFSLSIGETATFKGEQLRIQFLEIIEDSRCPRNVTCIWEGRVVAVIEVFLGGELQQIMLIEQGLSDMSVKEQIGEYEVLFRILPYPEDAEIQISPDEYYLMMTVNKN